MDVGRVRVYNKGQLAVVSKCGLLQRDSLKSGTFWMKGNHWGEFWGCKNQMQSKRKLGRMYQQFTARQQSLKVKGSASAELVQWLNRKIVPHLLANGIHMENQTSYKVICLLNACILSVGIKHNAFLYYFSRQKWSAVLLQLILSRWITSFAWPFFPCVNNLFMFWLSKDELWKRRKTVCGYAVIQPQNCLVTGL